MRSCQSPLLVDNVLLEDRAMNRTLLLGILIFFVVVGISLMGDQPQAVAGHGCYGMYGCGGCYGAPACGGCYGVSACGGCAGYLNHGYLARPLLFPRLRACFGSVGWRGCGGCYGYSGCYGYGTCYGYTGCGGYTAYYSTGDCYGCEGAVAQGGDVIQKGEVTQKPDLDAPAPTPAPEPETATEPGDDAPASQPGDDLAPPKAPGDDLTPPKPPAETEAAGDSAMLNVRVPAEAVVSINDYRTTSTGAARRYVSRGLEQGRTYRFEVRAEVERGGETLTQTKVVQLEATRVVDLMFDFAAPKVASVNR